MSEPAQPTAVEPVEADSELARRNLLAGWALFAVFVALAAGTLAVAFIYNAVASY